MVGADLARPDPGACPLPAGEYPDVTGRDEATTVAATNAVRESERPAWSRVPLTP